MLDQWAASRNPAPTVHYPHCNLATEWCQRSQFIRLHAASTGATEAFILLFSPRPQDTAVSSLYKEYRQGFITFRIKTYLASWSNLIKKYEVWSLSSHFKSHIKSFIFCLVKLQVIETATLVDWSPNHNDLSSYLWFNVDKYMTGKKVRPDWEPQFRAWARLDEQTCLQYSLFKMFNRLYM